MKIGLRLAFALGYFAPLPQDTAKISQPLPCGIMNTLEMKD